MQIERLEEERIELKKQVRKLAQEKGRRVATNGNVFFYKIYCTKILSVVTNIAVFCLLTRLNYKTK